MEMVDPILLAKTGKTISGGLKRVDLHRFSDLAKFGNRDVNFWLSFLFDEKGKCYIDGKADVSVKLECNRCSNLYSYLIDTTFLLYPVNREHITDPLYEGLDIVIMDNDLLSINNLIEDELLLNLPEIPMHEEDDLNCCSSQTQLLSANQVKQQDNPFAVLKDLHKTNK